MNGENQQTVQIEIGVAMLEALFNKGELCAFDIRCLNCESKQCIWNLCLTSCAKRMRCNLSSRVLSSEPAVNNLQKNRIER